MSRLPVGTRSLVLGCEREEFRDDRSHDEEQSCAETKGKSAILSICYFVHHGSSAYRGFPGGSGGEESAFDAGDSSSTPGWGQCPGEEKVNPLQCSCLENPMDRGA